MRRICLALVLSVGACGGGQSTGAAAPSAAPASTTANDDPNAQECHEEKPLGSNLPRTICRSRMDNTMDHQGAQDWHSLSNQPPSAVKGH